jgi:hypothetical protein
MSQRKHTISTLGFLWRFAVAGIISTALLCVESSCTATDKPVACVRAADCT